MRAARAKSLSPVGAHGADATLRTVLRVLALYQRFVSPHLGRWCRYEPSCSEYMRLSMLRYGLWRGLGRGALRLLSCAPWSRRPHFDPP